MKVTEYNNIKIKKVSGAIGAIIENIQLDKNLDGNTLNEIYDAFLKHQVIFFRDQNLNPESLLSFSKKLVHQLYIHLLKG